MKKILLKYKYLLGIILIVLIISFLLALKFYLVKNNQKSLDVKSEVLVSDNNENALDDVLEDDIHSYAEIKGAVNNPGVYEISDNDRISNFIDKAGGLREDGNTTLINLSKKVTDEMVIIIYTNDEVSNSNTFNTTFKIVQNECICPSIQNDGCLYNDVSNVDNNFSENSSSSQSNGKVNINTADIDELMTISGIGETKARAIISYRDEHGNFESIEDILNVSGIGQSTFDKIKENITV